MSKRVVTYLLVCLMVFGGAVNASKISSLVLETFSGQSPDMRAKVWIYFTDKIDDVSVNLSKIAVHQSAKSMKRRQNIPADIYDIPVNQSYIDQIRNIGIEGVRPSRWLNAVSAKVTQDDLTQIASLPFVDRIDIVKSFNRIPEPPTAHKPAIPPPGASDYGASFLQNDMLQTDSAHSLGYDGTGVLIAFMDTGYEIDHEAFDSMTILATYDFINNDSIVSDNVPSAAQTDHGTATLSACGGYSPGNLIGTAYGADYILAKTEDITGETQVEEDNWVFAAEWADSAGADIISTSLGYSDWYTPDSMDGNTAVITNAADLAASRGILVVTSAGNEGNNTWHTITAPADGDSVVAVGAVDPSLNPASFTSYGPSADGRVKPEVSALGSSTYCANDDNGGYYFKSGTSLSAPLIAGCAALILQANPGLSGNPMAIRQRLMEAGHLFPIADPNNRIGYGVPNIIEALQPMTLAAVPALYISPGQDTTIVFTVNSADDLPVSLSCSTFPPTYSFLDRGDGTAEFFIYGLAEHEGLQEFIITATSGSYSVEIVFSVITVLQEHQLFVGPNPFSESLTIQMHQDIFTGYEIRIFNLAGEKVFETHSESPSFNWEAINQDNEKIASGVYIIYVSADGIEEKVKVFKL